MRELKFRRYDDYEFVFFDLVDFRKYDEIPFVVQKSPIEQYTGLKDKNGKEIYEGDIVLDYYDGDDAFIVEWDKDTASFILTDTNNIANVSFDNFYPDKDLEIIGNIHENPELLGEK